MKILFSNYSPKICKSGTFVPKFKDFYFAANFANIQIQDVNFKYDNGYFEFQPKNILIKHFLLKIQAVLFLHETLQLWVNLILISKTELLISKCYCYSRIDKNFFFFQTNGEK